MAQGIPPMEVLNSLETVIAENAKPLPRRVVDFGELALGDVSRDAECAADIAIEVAQGQLGGEDPFFASIVLSVAFFAEAPAGTGSDKAGYVPRPTAKHDR